MHKTDESKGIGKRSCSNAERDHRRKSLIWASVSEMGGTAIGWSKPEWPADVDSDIVTGALSSKVLRVRDLRSAPRKADREHPTVRAAVRDRVKAVRRGAWASAFRCGFGSRHRGRWWIRAHRPAIDPLVFGHWGGSYIGVGSK